MITNIFRIQDICMIKSGKRLPAGADFSVEPTDYRYIRARDIKAGKISLDDVAYIDKETKNAINKYIINSEDVAITIVANIGDIGFATQDCDGANLTENAVRLTKFDESIVCSKYLSYYLGQPSMKTYMENLAAGAAQAKLGIYKIEKIKVQLPEVSIQKAVVGIIEQYDNLIEINNKRIKALEQMAENLYKEWFVRFRFPGHETAEFENGIPKGWFVSLNKKPKRWHYGTISELGSFVRGKNITSDEMIVGSIPVISAGIEPSGYHNKSNVKGKNITISASGANAGFLKYNLEDIWAADCSYMEDNDAFWFIYNSLNFIQSVISNLQCGAAQPHVYPKQINKLCIIIPERNYIIDFCRIVSPYYEIVGKLKKQNKNLAHQRDLLLPRLMSGRLEVDNLEQAKIIQPKAKLSYDEFLSELGMAARAKDVSEHNLKAMYNAYLKANATK